MLQYSTPVFHSSAPFSHSSPVNSHTRTRTHRYDVIISGRGFLSKFFRALRTRILVQHPPSLNPGYATAPPPHPHTHTLNTHSYVQELYMHLSEHRFTVLDWWDSGADLGWGFWGLQPPQSISKHLWFA